MLGLAALLRNTIGAEGFQHIQEKLAEICNFEITSGLRTAEADAMIDEWGVMRPAWNPLDAARNLFPRLYPRMVEIIQQIGGSGLVAMPTERDLKGPLVEDIKTYYQAARAEAFDRIPLFRLADVAEAMPSPAARCYTSGSFSATPCAWRVRWLPATPHRYNDTPKWCGPSCKRARMKPSPKELRIDESPRIFQGRGRRRGVAPDTRDRDDRSDARRRDARANPFDLG